MLLSASRGVGVLEMPAGRAKAKGGKGRSKVGAKKPIAKRRKANVGKKKQREVEDEGWDAEAGKELAARLGSDDDILRHVRKIKEKLRLDDAKPKTLSSLNLAAKFREVVDKDTRSVLTEIERVILDAAASILEGDGLGFQVPSRGASNQHYVQELDRIVLKDSKTQRSFGNRAEVRKVAIMSRLMQLVYELCSKDITATKRDLFYSDVKLFKKQDESDAALEDVTCMLGCTRCSLHVVASEKGLVVGRLRYREADDLIDCTRMGVGGKAIPSNIQKCTDFESDAEFILLVEKDAAFQRLAEDRFYNRFPCIIITGKGQPDVATRQFLRKMHQDLKLQVLALVDADPYGLNIISVYTRGSKNMSFDSSNLTTPGIKWLGVRPSDLDRFKLPNQCRLDMTEHDKRLGEKLLKEDFMKANPEWSKELQIMLDTGEKAEIQALSSFGFQYLTEVYLPLKLQEKDWI